MMTTRVGQGSAVVATVIAVGIALVGLVPQIATAEDPASSCLTCHGDKDTFDADKLAIVTGYAHDVHSEVGLSCQDCHGGNPDAATAEDMDAAMDPNFRDNPYRGAPERADVPGFCGRCHSDPDYMRKFKPDLRIDQEVEYWTSHHGKALKQGDPNVATCIDCHGVHGILRPSDPVSPVFPKNVAKTCGHCHSDPNRMSGYTIAGGHPLPVDQAAKWERSVHAAAMFQKDDLTAPTCNDCHGNHGAAPPGVQSVGYVCGQCHGREATLFRASAKMEGFEAHNELIADDQSTACADCHEGQEPQASMTRLHSFSECSTCHENHAVIRPTVALLGPLPDTPCSFCHESSVLEGAAGEPEKIRKNYEAMRAGLLEKAQTLGIEGNERFDWLVDQALQLPTHTTFSPDAETGLELRPEFKRLFDKFRIGKTQYTYHDPARNEEVVAHVIRCNDCHAASGDESAGAGTASYFLESMKELTLLTAQSERVLLGAQRGGVETSDALPELDQAVNAQIELEVLVHSFSRAEDGPFAKKHAEGVEHARAALAAGQSALGELSHRRTGLVTSLVIILFVLVALGFRIRQASFQSPSETP